MSLVKFPIDVRNTDNIAKITIYEAFWYALEFTVNS